MNWINQTGYLMLGIKKYMARKLRRCSVRDLAYA